MSDASQKTDSPGYGLMSLTAAAVLVALGAIFIYAPTERTEGLVQRIMYFHVPSAWIAFFAFFIVFVCSILFLRKKEREWDIYAHASAEIGIVFCSLVLITGPPVGQADLGCLVGLGCTSDLHTRIMANLCGISHAPGAERGGLHSSKVRRRDRNCRFSRHTLDPFFGTLVAHVSPGP